MIHEWNMYGNCLWDGVFQPLWLSWGLWQRFYIILTGHVFVSILLMHCMWNLIWNPYHTIRSYWYRRIKYSLCVSVCIDTLVLGKIQESMWSVNSCSLHAQKYCIFLHGMKPLTIEVSLTALCGEDHMSAGISWGPLTRSSINISASTSYGPLMHSSIECNTTTTLQNIGT